MDSLGPTLMAFSGLVNVLVAVHHSQECSHVAALIRSNPSLSACRARSRVRRVAMKCQFDLDGSLGSATLCFVVLEGLLTEENLFSGTPNDD